MKSVVVKISGKKAILLQSNDEFVCLPNNNYMLGQVVNVKERGGVKMTRVQKALITAAAAILVLLCGGLVYAYTVPQNYISIDVNPGIELEVNSFDKVVRAIGTNDDGVQILNQLELKNMSVEQALRLIISQEVLQGYIDPDKGNSILISVYNKSEENLNVFRERVTNEIENMFRETNVEAQIIVVNVDEDIINEAEELGVTAGKLALVKAYNSYEETNRTQEELMNMSVHDILSTLEDEDDFFEEEDVEETVDTVSGASEMENEGEKAEGGVDTVTGASEQANGENGVDGVSGASANVDDDEYDDDDDEYEDHEDEEDEHGGYDEHDERDEHEDSEEEDDD
ncbi:MAG: hypothetical protein AB1Z23_01100 [Eubacteriales bacterium]